MVYNNDWRLVVSVLQYELRVTRSCSFLILRNRYHHCNPSDVVGGEKLGQASAQDEAPNDTLTRQGEDMATRNAETPGSRRWQAVPTMGNEKNYWMDAQVWCNDMHHLGSIESFIIPFTLSLSNIQVAVSRNKNKEDSNRPRDIRYKLNVLE
jgi:hypothetical protein